MKKTREQYKIDKLNRRKRLEKINPSRYSSFEKYIKGAYMCGKTIYDFVNTVALKPLQEEGIVFDNHDWSIDQDTIWINKVYQNLHLAVKTKGMGIYNYTQLLNSFDFPCKSDITVQFVLQDYLDNNMNGSTIIDFMSFSNYCIKKMMDMSEQLGEDYELLDKDFILDSCLRNDFILLNDEYRQTKNKEEIKYLTSRKAYNTEKFIFQYLKNVGEQKYTKITDCVLDEVINTNSFKLNEKQELAVRNFKNSGVNILNGYGGTGKSATLSVILRVLDLCEYKYVLLAPTGISRKVLADYTGKEVYTIHKFCLSGESLKGIDVIIIDENSMLGLDHWYMLMTQMKKDDSFPKIIMLGDTNQLQPISAGCFFRDIIDMSEIKLIQSNTTTLTQIMRAKSDTFIPYVCGYFCWDNSAIEQSLYNNEENRVSMIPLGEELDDTDVLAEFIYEYMKAMNFNFYNTQIIIPQRVGNKGTTVINERLLQYHLKEKDAKPIGMFIKNNYNANVMNGEKFKILREDKEFVGSWVDKNGVKHEKYKSTYVVQKLDDEKEIITFSSEDDSFKWEYAYACTVHKLQGCTSENVIFLCSKTHTFMLTKQLVYTGLSRASQSLTILYDKWTFEGARKKNTIYDRKTFLGRLVYEWKEKLQK